MKNSLDQGIQRHWHFVVGVAGTTIEPQVRRGGGGGGGGVGRQSNVDPGRVTAGTQGPAPLAPRARHHHRCQLSHRGERGNEHLLLIQQKLQTIK